MSEQDDFRVSPEPRNPFDIFGLREAARQNPGNLFDVLNQSLSSHFGIPIEELAKRQRAARDRVAAAAESDLTPEGDVRINLRHNPAADATAEGYPETEVAESDDATQYHAEPLLGDLPSVNSVFEYPVSVRQHLPGIGYLVFDSYSQGRDYWIPESVIANPENPTLLAALLSVDENTLLADVLSPDNGKVVTFPVSSRARVQREFSLDSFLEGVRRGQITVLYERVTEAETSRFPIPVTAGSGSEPTGGAEEGEGQMSSEEAQVEPEVGMEIEFPVFIQRIIKDYAALVTDEPESQDYSIRVSDLTVTSADETVGNIRGTVIGVTDDRITVELFSPSDQYKRTYPRSLKFKDVTVHEEPIPGHLYRTYDDSFDTMLYDGEYFIPLETYPYGKLSREELPKYLQDGEHISYN